MPNILWSPNRGAQTAFLSTTADEVLYGGAVGGGKTDALLVWPLHRASHPEHRSIYLRRERRRLQESIDRARLLYSQVDPAGYWHETELRWKWSTGAITYFGHAEHETDIEQYKSFEFDLVLFDELTEFTEWQYKFMFMRNRSKVAAFRPWVRSGTNPGGPGLAWVDDRFVGFQAGGKRKYENFEIYEHKVEVRDADGVVREIARTRQYIPATVFDNPKMPQREAYLAGLAELPEEEREAYVYGRWGRWQGQFFRDLPEEVAHGFKQLDWYIIRGLDYGYDPDPTCIVWLVVYPKTGIIEVVAEVCKTKLTTDGIAQVIEAEESTLRITSERIAASVMSPDAWRKGQEGKQSIASMLNERGVWFTRANNDRVAGWAALRRALASKTLKVWQGQAPVLLSTLPRLRRDPKKRDDIMLHERNDHAAEALRYAVVEHYADTNRKIVAPTPIQTQRIDPHWKKLQEYLQREQSRQSDMWPW